MRKKILATLFGTLFCLIGSAQVTTVYSENFDPPSGPDSVSTYNTSAILNSEWNDTNHLWVSSPMSYHSRVVPFDSVIFETDNFSTVGNIFIRFKFNQICKIYFGQRGYIQASNDGGTTWSNVTGPMYQGNSPQFSSVGYFNELSYPSPQITPYWHGPTTSPTNIVNPTNNWWSEETFDVSSILGGTNGYPNCKIRFIVVHQLSAPFTLSGWYVDNLLVEAAPCELEPPTLTYNVIPFRKPIGARYNASQQMKIRVRDNTGIDSMLVYWRLNKGPWTVDTMTTPTSCPDSIEFTHNWTNINLYDTIDWYVEIYDCACPNMTRDPNMSTIPNYYTFWRDLAPPPICGAAYPNSFPLVIQSFPWVEDFESNAYWTPGTGTGATGTAHRGVWPTDNTPTGLNWEVAPNATSTGFAWSIRSGGTSTNNTGPNGDHTTGSGKYIYTEASQGNGSGSPKFTQAITPCIDLGTVGCAALEFYYHMYGADVDRIRIDVDTGTTVSSYVNNIFIVKDQQQNSSNAGYTKAFVSLEQFAGKIIRIRFLARKNTSVANDKNDMAIDDIRIFEPTPVDVEATNYYTPKNGYCGYSNAEVVSGRFQNLGCQTLTAVPVVCKIQRTPPGTTIPNPPTFIRDTIFGSFGLGDDTTFTFTPTANLSAYGTYKLWIYSDVPGDTVNGNDTTNAYTIVHNQPFSGFPYILDFDGPTTVPGNGTNNNPGTVGNDDWERIPDPTTASYAFHVKTQKTPSAATGPRTDYSSSGDGNYLYTEGNYGTSPTSALFVSKCFDLTGLTSPVLDFMYHMYGTDIGALAMQIVPNGSNAWVAIPGVGVTQPSQMQTSSVKDWNYLSADLSSWAGQVVKVRFVAQKTGLGSASDIAIDNIRIYDKINTDVGIINFNGPSQRVDTANPDVPVFVIRNFGKNSVTGVPITYTITPTCGPNAGISVTYNTTYTGTIAAGAEYAYAVPASAMPNYPIGDFEICASTNKTGDTYSFNNSFCKRSVGWPMTSIQTGFSEDFDNCNGGTASGFWQRGDYRIFKIESTATPASTPNSYNSLYWPYTSYPSSNEYLNAPRFMGFDTIVGAQLWFSHKFNFGSNDVGVVEYQTGANWLPLGFDDPDDEIGINWYNGANIPAANNGAGFVQNSAALPGSTNGWITSMWPLNIYNWSSSPLILRWNHISAGGGSTGWGVDNVEIRIPPQNSAAPYAIETKEYLLMPNQPATVQARVQNTGAKKLDSCMVSYAIDGVWTTPQKVVFSPNLITGKISDWVDFNIKWQNPISGPHTICVATSRPNNKQDNFTPDDTLCEVFKVLDEITFTAADPDYCNNFDDPNQIDWIEINTSKKSGLVSWEKGTPNQAPIIGAHSAPNAWMTKLNNNYKLRDSSSLFTPVFVTDSFKLYDISFWHNFKTELYHDGGTIDVTFDGGINWRTIGYVFPDTSVHWYNTNHVTSLDILNPGWSGESGGWIKSGLTIQFDQDRKSVLRFRFASDQSFEYQGWAIDDFCMKQRDGTDTPDDFIGVEEMNSLDFIDVGNIIPNPSNGLTRIPYFMNTPADLKVSIYNMLGQEMLSFADRSEIGVNSLEFDVTGWAPGMYVVAIQVNGEQITKKMMVR